MRYPVYTMFYLLCACASRQPGRQAEPADLLIQHATLIDAHDGTLIPHTSVLVRGQIIVWRGPDGSAPHVPAATRVVSASASYLMPGMADMHVHLPAEDEAAARRVLSLSVAHGVTTLRSMQGAPMHLALRDKLAHEPGVSPRLLLDGPPLGGEMTEDEASAAVLDQKRRGYDAIKILGGFSADVYRAIARSCELQQIPFEGHLPASVSVFEATAAHQRSIEHLGGYLPLAESSEAELAQAVQQTRAAGVYNCPTLNYYASSIMTPEELRMRDSFAAASDTERCAWTSEPRRSVSEQASARLQRLRAIVRALADAHAPLLVGSDTPAPYSLPGYGYWDELNELAIAGLTHAEIIHAATCSAAPLLGHGACRLADGELADAVLWPDNPLQSLTALKRPLAVLMRGKWLDRTALDALERVPAAGDVRGCPALKGG